MQAMATAFVIAFIPIIGSISILIAALVTLRKGIIDGALVTIAATLPCLIGYFAWTPEATEMQMELVLVVFIITRNILTWFFAVVLRRFSNWSFVFELAALLGILVVGTVHMIQPDIQSWWAQQLTTYFHNIVDSSTKIPADLQHQEINIAKLYATGFVVVLVLGNALLQLVIARWWQAAMFNPGELRKELHQIHLGHIAGIIFAIVLVLAYLGINAAMDELPILYIIFFVAGLSLLHCFVSTIQGKWSGLNINKSLTWLFLIYLGIFITFPFSLLLVSMFALIDTGVDFRKRFNLMR
jgi:hypothetical protein